MLGAALIPRLTIVQLAVRWPAAAEHVASRKSVAVAKNRRVVIELVLPLERRRLGVAVEPHRKHPTVHDERVLYDIVAVVEHKQEVIAVVLDVVLACP